MTSLEAPAENRSCNGRAAVFLDRDGVINVECHYLSHPDQVELLPGAAAGLRRLQGMGFLLIVVTNQSGVGRGYFDLTQLAAVHARLRSLLLEHGVRLDGVYFCPHVAEDLCTCRKPDIGMAEQALQDLGFDRRRTFLIGDRPSDLEMGRRFGSTTILVTTGYGAQSLHTADPKPDYVVNDLVEAADIIEMRKGQWL